MDPVSSILLIALLVSIGLVVFLAIKNRGLEQETSKLEKEIGYLNKDLENFTYVASHDLKTPLRAIASMTQWIHDDFKDKLDEEALNSLSEVSTRSNRMNKLIDGILEYSRVGRMNNEIESFESLGIIQDAIEAVDVPETINVKINKPETFPTIDFNDVSLDMIITQLLINALEHSGMQYGGLIQINYQDNGSSHQFSVEDNGQGVDEENFERIFIIFQSLGVQNKVKNIGMGLTTIKKTIEYFNGDIRVESPEGEGCKFIFNIPKNLQEQ